MNQKEASEFLRAHADWLKENWEMTPEGRAYRIRFNEALAAIIPDLICPSGGTMPDSHKLQADERNPDQIIRDLRDQIEALEDVVSSQRCTIDRAVEAERERIIGILNNPSIVLTADIQYSGNGAAWFGENFLAEYLKP